MPGPPTRSQVLHLDEKLELTIHEIDELKPLVRESNRRSKRSELIGVIGVVVGVIGVGSGIMAWRAVVAANASRDEARYAACVGFNVGQAGDRAGALNSVLVTFGFTEAGTLTEADREAIVAGLAPELQERYRQVEQQAAFDNPFRDCTEDGIVDFNRNPPVDPGAPPTSAP